MCLEDIMLGRVGKTTSREITVGTTALQLLAPDRGRWGFIICGVSANALRIAPSPNVGLTHGLVLDASNLQFAQNIMQHGQASQCGWLGMLSAATAQVTIIETIYSIDEMQMVVQELRKAMGLWH